MKKMIVLSVLAIWIALCAASAADAAAAAAVTPDVIGVIDSQGILSKHPKFEESTRELQQISRQKESEAKAAADKETDAARKGQVVQAKRMELAREEQRLMEPIYKDCQEAVRVVAKNRKITVVLDKVSVYFGGLDITDDVVQQLNRMQLK
jgi:outer membrane protein